MSSRISGEDEEILISKLKAGEEWAFDAIYELYANRLFGQIVKFTRLVEPAQEILQDVFLKVWEQRHRLDSTKSFRSYIFRITENKVYDYFRKASGEKRLLAGWQRSMEYGTNSTDDLLEQERSRQLLEEAIAGLPPQRKRVFTLCKIEGLSYEEVGRQLGISPSTVNDHIVKAMHSIRAYIQEHPDTGAAISLLFLLWRR